MSKLITMKKLAIFSIGAFVVIAFSFLACKKKSDNGAIKPDYSAEAGGGGNPNAGQATQTGSVPITNPASENSSINVGGTGWLSPSCASSGSLSLKGINGSVEVTLSFSSPPMTGTYNVSTSSGPSNVQVTVVNAPNQPAGITWYGKTGMVAVNTNSSSINANFTGIQCTQSNFNFPVVTIIGNVGCN